MRIDLYTKTVLTIIMLLLGVVALRPLASPTTTAQAYSPFSGLRFSGGAGGFWLFNDQTGDAWWYDVPGGAPRHVKLQDVGDPMVQK